MNIKKQIPTFFISIAVLLFACNSATEEETNEVPPAPVQQQAAAEMMPSFLIQDVTGVNFNLSTFAGKKTFVNLWATWCPPCRKEIPSIEGLQAKVDTSKVAFVLLSLDKNFQLAKDFAVKNKMKLPIYYPAENLPALFNVQGIPATFIFNEQGELIKAVHGMDDYDTREYADLLK